MKNITLNLLMVGFLLYSSILFSQEKKTSLRTSQPYSNGTYKCFSEEYNSNLLKNHPEMMGGSTFEKKLQNIIKSRKASKLQSSNGATLVRIPVVVHVIHNGTAIGVGANITNAQILSQIQVLNEDYRKKIGTRGYNTNPVGADTNIEFYLAKEDPDCNPTTGIERYDLSNIATTWPIQGITDSQLKPMTIWDSSRYMNMWTVEFEDPAYLGYAQYPGGPPESDGVVMDYRYFGSNDAPGVNLDSSAPYDLGRTTTHEVGHFLGLLHTFEGGCTGVGDGVADTPAVKDPNFGCPVGTNSCPAAPGLDMIENYMDYTDDACMNIFTNGQSARMDGVLSSDRLSLANSTVPDTDLPSVSYDASIKIKDLNLDPCSGSFAPVIKLANYGTVNLTAATITYNLNGGTPQLINWTGTLLYGESEIINLSSMVTPAGSNDFNVSVSQSNTDQRSCNDTGTENFSGVAYETATQIHLTLVTDDWAIETSWDFRDSSNTILESDFYSNLDDNKTFNYTFEVVPNECYTFTIYDDASDGICCAYGNGSYELKTNYNTIIKSGGVFGASESTIISTTALNISDYFYNNDISLFPNPTNNDLTIRVKTINDLPNTVQIFNMIGQNISFKKISNPEDLNVKTSTLSKGMYFIKITKENASITLPFIKK